MARAVVQFIERNQFPLLRISIGILFIWFGALKFFPGVSPAEGLATKTVELLTFHLFPIAWIIPSLALLEVTLGLMLIFRINFKISFWLLIFHMVCTITPLFILKEITFNQFPFQLTIEGQYIVKNIVIICAAFVLLFQHQSNRYQNKG